MLKQSFNKNKSGKEEERNRNQMRQREHKYQNGRHKHNYIKIMLMVLWTKQPVIRQIFLDQMKKKKQLFAVYNRFILIIETQRKEKKRDEKRYAIQIENIKACGNIRLQDQE